jgi:predicted HicB family RNase H-like nuclease
VKPLRDTHLGIRVDVKLKEELQRRAKQDRRSLSDYVNIILEESVDNENSNDKEIGQKRNSSDNL